MPYDLPFERVAEVDNESALKLNKSTAAKLIAAFPEIHDLNHSSSRSYFKQRKMDDLDDELPELHFSLYAEIEGMNFSFGFWRNILWLEIGAWGDIHIRFAHVRRYAAFILQQGFKINPELAGEALTLDEGITWHLQEYKEWVGFVERVFEHISTPPPKTE